jgi:arylsulfatase A-like enzyme
VLETLGKKGYLDNALVVITADHGEALGERGLYAHANGVDQEVLRIPLLWLAFGYPGSTVSNGRRVVSQVDIAPTILADLGMPLPRTWSGRPLQHGETNDFVYFQDRQAAGFIDQRTPGQLWKYWVNSATGKEHAYNLTADPDARTNVMETVDASRKREWRLNYLQMMPGATGVLGGSEPVAAGPQ